MLDRQARELLWAHRDELDGIVVQTTAALDLPWELLLVRAPGTKGDPDDRFLADYGVTRWVVGAPHPTSIRVRRTRARYLCPQYAEPDLALSRTSAEGEAVARRFRRDRRRTRRGLRARGPHVRWLRPAPLRRARAMESATEHRQEVLLGGFRPDDTGLAARYSDADARRDLRKRPESETSPLVVLNATDLGRLPAGRTCRTGFAEAFLRAGAGAFVWRGWSLDDDPASPFVEAFYDAFVEGSTIEEGREGRPYRGQGSRRPVGTRIRGLRAPRGAAAHRVTAPRRPLSRVARGSSG
ncbi:CHAT domain-containing protein [Agromyces flavus]|uniref:CHAT domain-containing protein n=1 Tax=Agromyces flavus TaxID=589382 RepID=UPI00361B3687